MFFRKNNKKYIWREREEHIVHLCYTSNFSFFRFHPFCLFCHLDMKWTLGLFCVVLLSE